MSDNTNREPMIDMFIFETLQLIEQLEQLVLNSERTHLPKSSVDEVFRIMHTIKGTSSMMLFENISSLAHSIEDVFYYIREEKPDNINYSSLTDMLLESVDFIKNEVDKIESNLENDGNPDKIIKKIKMFLVSISLKYSENKSVDKVLHNNCRYKLSRKKYRLPSSSCLQTSINKSYKATIIFHEDCKMENLRAFNVIHNLKKSASDIYHLPKDIVNDRGSSEAIQKDGFRLLFKSELGMDKINELLNQTIFLKELRLSAVENFEEELKSFINHRNIVLEEPQPVEVHQNNELPEGDSSQKNVRHSMISVNIAKLDRLMDLVGELVISEAMVTQNPDLRGLVLENFHKSSRQLHKITKELQDAVMAIRMIPLSITLQKMNRIVRDMSKNLNKEVHLEIIGEETEVDKNIIEHISDPLMHLIRNSLDHGIEDSVERLLNGKEAKGTVIIEARNQGGDVWITVKDDGRGLNIDKIYQKAYEHGLTSKKKDELSDREIYSMILLPGFTTKENVTKYSGRGVGMDVVQKNIENIGGEILIDSIPGESTSISLKIPLTLAIIEGMIIRVGKSIYILPITSIKESFKVNEKSIICDPQGNEIILLRGECYPVLRLHRLYKIKTEIQKIQDGITIMIESGSKSICILADELIGEQQVVVKPIPSYLKKVKGIAGCTLLGDGSIGLILDVTALVKL